MSLIDNIKNAYPTRGNDRSRAVAIKYAQLQPEAERQGLPTGGNDSPENQHPSSPEEISDAQLREAVDEIAQHMAETNHRLRFQVDEHSNRAVVTVFDEKSGDIVRQIPSQEVLQLARHVQEMRVSGGTSVLFDKKA